MVEESQNDTEKRSLMSDGEAHGRARQWVRDIRLAHRDFEQRLNILFRMSGARPGMFLKHIRAAANKHLTSALINCKCSNQRCELMLLNVSDEGQLMLMNIKVTPDRHYESSYMNIRLSVHFIARLLQYFRIRESNPIENSVVAELLIGIRQLDGSAIGGELILHGEDGLVAEAAYSEENSGDGGVLVTLTTLITRDSLYPDRLRKAEQARQLLIARRQSDDDE